MVKPHILLINPNTSAEITEAIRQLALAEIGDQAVLTAVTAPFGARYIATRTAVTIAAHAVIDAYAQATAEGRKYDAVVVACFGDPGVDALKEITAVPVLGFADGGLIAAAAEPGSFAIATIGEAWRDMLIELALRRGFADRLAGVILIDENGRLPEIAGPQITAAAKTLGVSRVIVGGTGLIPILDAIADQVGVTVIDPHRSTLHDAIRATAGAPEAEQHRPASNSPFAGLSPALLGLLQNPRIA
ncbi:MAG: Hydantoin racemase [Devosia sp.]|uniref:aspartate/glutamate racemase family protein n=1 Tax=Devosia sp. TaxID=1871048 RepID=UPI00263A053E|nr:aspartate/glutamate racemase family protein [Devosia sp.]MDB5588874.1 Hydantoin racemase [Devosia sp.]